jgi:hypothetical protein
MNHPDIIEEFDQIQYTIQLERMQKSTKAQQILFNPKVRRQLIIGCLLQFFQQLACTNTVVSRSVQLADLSHARTIPFHSVH